MELLPSIFSPERSAFLTNPFKAFEEALGRTWPTSLVTTGNTFALDLVELPDKYALKADLPGIDRKCVDISFENQVLTIRVEAATEEEKKEARYLMRERLYQTVMRSVTLPLADPKAAIDAVMKDGVLKITVPKSHEKQTKRIEIH